MPPADSAAILDRSGYEIEVEDRFERDVLDERLWLPYYLPHWSSRQASAARYDVGGGRLAGMQLHDKGFSFYAAVHDLEARLIEQALEETGGSVTKAAGVLGVPYQTLTTMLKTRHKRLQKKRKPAQKRLRSIIKKPKE